MRSTRGLLWAAVVVIGAGGPAAAEEREVFTPAAASVAVERDRAVFRAGDDEAAVYAFGRDLAKPILWPLKAPGGQEVTRAWPMREAPPGGTKDHVHQKSAWFTYGDVVPEGREIKHPRRGVRGIDFWAEEPGSGRIVCVRTGTPRRDGNHVRLNTHNEWRTADGDKVLDEERTVHFYNFTTARLFVVDIDLHASVVPILFADTKEGAFGVRVADSMTEKKGKGKITNAEGATGMLACWGRVSAWCDYSGPVGGETVGVALFAAPDNPLPSCWHSRDYGLMAANPFGRARSGFPAMRDKKDEKDLVRLAKGEHLKMRYGLFLHQGDVKQGKVAEGYEMFKRIK